MKKHYQLSVLVAEEQADEARRGPSRARGGRAEMNVDDDKAHVQGWECMGMWTGMRHGKQGNMGKRQSRQI